MFSAKLQELKQRLLGKIAELGKELPLNTLDELIDRFGGPEKVSEVRSHVMHCFTHTGERQHGFMNTKYGHYDFILLTNI